MNARFTLLALSMAAVVTPLVPASQCAQSEDFEIIGSDADVEGYFGRAVDVSGSWVAVGAANHQVDDEGAVYLFELGPFVDEVKITPPDPGVEGVFGHAVAIHGPWLAIGEPEWDSERGRVHLYHHDGNHWQPAQILEGDDPGELFSNCLDVDSSSGLLAVGTQAEAVALYGWNGSSWEDLRRLKPLVPGAFGDAVSLSGNRLAVGAPKDADKGAVYLYEGSGLAWDLISKVTHPNIGVDDDFGISVALDGDHVIIGAPLSDLYGPDAGAAFSYSFDGSDWIAGTVLEPQSPGDLTGIEVALDGDVAVVGSHAAENPHGLEGVLFQYRLQGSTWVFQQALYNSDPIHSALGSALAVQDGVVYAADYKDDTAGDDVGALFGFELPGLSFAIQPEAPTFGENLYLDTCGGAPGNPVILFAVGIDGLPIFLRITQSTFDAEGGWTLLGGYDDPTLAGLSVDLMSFGLDAAMKVRSSNVATVEFQ